MLSSRLDQHLRFAHDVGKLKDAFEQRHAAYVTVKSSMVNRTPKIQNISEKNMSITLIIDPLSFRAYGMLYYPLLPRGIFISNVVNMAQAIPYSPPPARNKIKDFNVNYLFENKQYTPTGQIFMQPTFYDFHTLHYEEYQILLKAGVIEAAPGDSFESITTDRINLNVNEGWFVYKGGLVVIDYKNPDLTKVIPIEKQVLRHIVRCHE